jgi:hypothetical protein
MAKLSIPSVARPGGPRPTLRPQPYPIAKRRGNRKQSACQSQNRVARVRRNRSQGYLSQAVLRIWCSPPKASDRQSNTAPTTFGKRRRGVVERSQLAVGKEPDAGLLVHSRLEPARPVLRAAGSYRVRGPGTCGSPKFPVALHPARAPRAESPAVTGCGPVTNSQNDYVSLTTRHSARASLVLGE